MEKFIDLNVKCEILHIQTLRFMERGWDDVLPTIFQLEPKNLSLKVWLLSLLSLLRCFCQVYSFDNQTLLTSEFLREECIRNRQQLHIEAYPLSCFDDQVSCSFKSISHSLHKPPYMIGLELEVYLLTSCFEKGKNSAILCFVIEVEEVFYDVWHPILGTFES